jgi:hypothetical protein
LMVINCAAPRVPIVGLAADHNPVIIIHQRLQWRDFRDLLRRG